VITPDDIRQKAERLYLPMLRAWIEGAPFFPQELAFRKPQAADDYLSLRAEVAALLADSKAERGHGYSVALQPRQMRSYGTQSLPARVTVDSEADLLWLVKKASEASQFKQDVAAIRAALPQLEAWLRQNPAQVIAHAGAWPGLLLVGTYFLAHPRPALYARELPIPIHTKFVEQHTGILRRLLDALLPPVQIAADEALFERRFGLRYDEPLLRLRILDSALQAALGLPIADLSVPISQVAQLDLAQRRCLVVENKLTFLTLPELPDTFAVFGSGYAIALLRHTPWLAACPLAYWGDLDAHGFGILAQLRAFQPAARSIMMDAATLAAFAEFVVAGQPHPATSLPGLDDVEQRLFATLREQNLRLEQERIEYAYAIRQLRIAFLDGRAAPSMPT